MRSILGTGPPDTMHCLRLHDTPAVAVRGHFPQQRQRLPASVLSGNEWDSGVVPQFWRLKTAVAAQSLSLASAFRQSRLQSTDDFKFPTCR